MINGECNSGSCCTLIKVAPETNAATKSRNSCGHKAKRCKVAKVNVLPHF